MLSAEKWWRPLEGGRVECRLCPRLCALKEGDRGFCFVRQNVGQQVVLTTYGRSTGFCIDPIEKKPLNHFFPGTSVLSFGTAGCNLGCKFCQNWSISKSREVELASEEATPETIAAAATRLGCRSVAFTYNDPVVWAEYAIDTARACRAQGLKTVAVTAGYIMPEARETFFAAMDAANVDLKGFTESFYQHYTLSHLKPVLETLRWLKRETNVWLEVTNLVIPRANDDPSELQALCEWCYENLGAETPLHFSAFHPDFRLRDRPPTPHETLLAAHATARAAGLKYVYTGNVHDVAHQSTYCPGCGSVLIERNWYQLGTYGIVAGACRHCGTKIAGHFDNEPGTWGSRRQPVRIAQFAPAGEVKLAASFRRATEDPPGMNQPSPAAMPPSASESSSPPLANLSVAHQQAIHRAAWEAVRSEATGTPATRAVQLPPELAQLPVAGVFVTLKRSGRLRGCCGMLGQPVPLGEALEHSGRRCAGDDVRFPPVTPFELPALALDVSLLHNRKRVTAPAAQRAQEIEIGRHGVQIFLGQAHPLLLPQVAVEAGFSPTQFLEHVCLKGGLPATTWQEEQASLFTFEAQHVELDERPECEFSERPLFSPAELQALAEHCRANLRALLAGEMPNYFAFGLPDRQFTGACLALRIGEPSAGNEAPQLYAQQFALREGVPLQTTLLSLCQNLVAPLRAALRSEGKQDWHLDLALLDRPALHGSVAEPCLAGCDTPARAMLVLEAGRSAWVFDGQATAAQRLAAAAEAVGVTSGAAAQVFSLAVAATTPRLVITNRPRGTAGPALRAPAVAGTFYPSQADELSRLVAGFFSPPGSVKKRFWPAAMVPHAGLVYSGRIAAQVLERIEIPETVVVLGPKHTPHGVPWAVAPHEGWSLPGTTVRGNYALARRLAAGVPGLLLDAAAHAAEHAIEVELPLLARLRPDVKVVGIALGGANWEQCQRLAQGLAAVLAEDREKTLLLISSDMNHYASDAENRRLDELALAALETLDPQRAFETITGRNISMCGIRPATIVLETLRLWGGLHSAQRVAYATSGDVSGDRNRVVGYAGMLFE